MIILGKYVNSSTHIQCKCSIDNYEWMATPNKLLQGRSCPRCAKKEPYSESFERRIREKFPTITLLSHFVSGNTAIKCRCEIDGYEWDVVPYALMKSAGCPKCSGKKQLSHEEFERRVRRHHKRIEIIGMYTNNTTNVLCRCLNDGHEWYANPKHLMNGVGCPVCAGVSLKTHEQFVKEMRIVQPQIDVLGVYKGNKKKVECRCKICDTKWNASPNALLQHKAKCPSCSKAKSSGEQRISFYLDNHGIDFRTQYCFEDCKDRKKLRFDFYLPDYNMTIEFDGVQHFRPINFGGMSDAQSVSAFKDCQLHDRIKNDFCRENDINLLRIDYTQYDEIEKILDKHLL